MLQNLIKKIISSLSNSKYLKLLTFLPIVLVIFLGRFYDERIQFFGIDVSIFISITYFLSFVFYVQLSPQKNSINHYHCIALCLFTIIMCISFLSNNYYTDVSFNYGFLKTTHFVTIHFIICFLILLTFNMQSIDDLFNLIFIICLVFIGLGLFKVTFGSETYDEINRLSVLGGGPIVFARWVYTGALIALIYKKPHPLISIFFVFLTLYLASLSGSKGPMAGFIVALLFVGVMFILQKLSISNLFKFFIFGLIFLFLLTFASKLDVLPSRIAMLFDFEKLLESTSFLSRFDRIIYSFKIIEDYPLGVGVGNWAYYFNMYSSTFLEFNDYPHNIFIEIYCEYGIVSLVLFLITILGPVFTFVKSIFSIKFSKYIIIPALLIFNLVNCNFSGDINDARQLFIFSSLLFIYNTLQKKNESTTI